MPNVEFKKYEIKIISFDVRWLWSKWQVTTRQKISIQ